LKSNTWDFIFVVGVLLLDLGSTEVYILIERWLLLHTYILWV